MVREACAECEAASSCRRRPEGRFRRRLDRGHLVTPSRWGWPRARARAPSLHQRARRHAHANLDATARLARRLDPCPVIASGGVSQLSDLDALLDTGAFAVVIGKALYEGVFTVEDALRRVRERARI